MEFRLAILPIAEWFCHYWRNNFIFWINHNKWKINVLTFFTYKMSNLKLHTVSKMAIHIIIIQLFYLYTNNQFLIELSKRCAPKTWNGVNRFSNTDSHPATFEVEKNGCSNGERLNHVIHFIWKTGNTNIGCLMCERQKNKLMRSLRCVSTAASASVLFRNKQSIKNDGGEE